MSDDELKRRAAEVEAALAADLEQAFAGGGIIGQVREVTPEDRERLRSNVVATVVEQARRNGVPVVRGYMDGECIVLEHMRPAGHG